MKPELKQNRLPLTTIILLLRIYRTISDFHAKPSGFPNLTKKPNNLRVFTFAELKAATNNFDIAWNIGEGGFGCVYKGVIQNLEHPFDEIQVAVKYAKGVMKASLSPYPFLFLFLSLG